MKQNLVLDNINPFSKISTRAFQLSLKDGRDIRSRYIKARQISFYKADKTTKNDMIEFILRNEFDDSLVNEYFENVNIWRKYEETAIQDWIETLTEEKEKHYE